MHMISGLGWHVHEAASKDTFRIAILEHEKRL